MEENTKEAMERVRQMIDHEGVRLVELAQDIGKGTSPLSRDDIQDIGRVIGINLMHGLRDALVDITFSASTTSLGEMLHFANEDVQWLNMVEMDARRIRKSEY